MASQTGGEPAHQTRRGVILASSTFASFATADALVKWLSGGYSVFQITGVTALFAMLPVIYLVMKSGGWRSMKPASMAAVSLRAALIVVATVSAYYAFSILSMAEVYTLTFMVPILVVVLSIIFLGERIGPRRTTAVVIGFIGILIILRPGFQPLGLAHLGAATCAVCLAFAAVLLRKIGHSETDGALLVSLMVALILAGYGGSWLLGDYKPVSALDWGLMALAGLFIGAGHCLFVYAVRAAPVALVSPFQYTRMLWAVLYGAVLFGQLPDGWTWVGSVIVIGAGIFIVKRDAALKDKTS